MQPIRKAGALARLSQFWLGETNLAPLGLFRVVYGLLLFNWVWQLLPNVNPFFTDEGMLPRYSLLAFHPGRFSLLSLVGEWWGIFLFWLAGLVVALMLTVGYRTRAACIMAFLLVISFQWRNPLILDGSDLVFRLVPFWMIFTAAGDRFSIDAAIRRVRGDPPRGFGPALPVRLLELQIAWIYLMTGVAKLAGLKWQDGTATYYVLQLKHTFGRALAEPLVANPLLMRLMTWGTLLVELAYLPLVFSPLRQRYARLLAIVSVAMLHLGIIALMNVGNFPVIMLATLILFFPPELVYRIVDRGRWLLPRAQVRLAYDGACHTCRRTVAYLDVFDIYKTVSFVDIRAADSSPAGYHSENADEHFQALDERGRLRHGLDALACAARAVPLLALPALIWQVPGLPRLARNLYRRAVCHHALANGAAEPVQSQPGPGSPGAEPRSAVAGRAWWRMPGYALLAIVAAAALSTSLPQSFTGFRVAEPWNGAVQRLATYRPPDALNRVLQLASLDQSWNMFAPDPMAADGWLLAPARLGDGTEIDLISSGPPSDEPRYADPFYSRWAKVTERIADSRNVDYRQEYGRMYCRLRNLHLQPGQQPIATFDLYYAQRWIPSPGGESVVVKHHLWSHTC